MPSGFLGYPQREGLEYKLDKGTESLRQYVQSQIIAGPSVDIERVARYEMYWRFYEGEHWRAFNDTLLSFNYIAAFINKINTFLVGDKPITFKVTAYDNTTVSPEVESKLEGIIERVWNKNKKMQVVKGLLQCGSVTGDVWCLVEYDKTKKYSILNILDSRQCFPVFKHGDITNMESFTVRMPLLENDKKYKVFVKSFTKDVIKTWYQKDTTNNETTEKFEPSEETNTYGYIPLVHIQNSLNSKGYFGYSDARDILKINKLYNEKAQEMNNIIDYYGTPTTVITGANARGLVKQLGNIWSGLPPEANVFNLSLGEDLSGFIQYMKEILKTGMHEIGDVPENALGKIQAISNTSAAALQITYQPLIQQAGNKALMYGDGISEINTMILDQERRMGGNTSVSEKEIDTFVISPVWTYGLPYDRLSDLQQAQIESQLKISSRSAIMNRLGVKDVPSALDEIDEDLLRLKELDLNGIMNQGENNFNAPPNEE
jgi:hypothetical protein